MPGIAVRRPRFLLSLFFSLNPPLPSSLPLPAIRSSLSISLRRSFHPPPLPSISFIHTPVFTGWMCSYSTGWPMPMDYRGFPSRTSKAFVRVQPPQPTLKSVCTPPKRSSAKDRPSLGSFFSGETSRPAVYGQPSNKKSIFDGDSRIRSCRSVIYPISNFSNF